jgi:hypothetical protein
MIVEDIQYVRFELSVHLVVQLLLERLCFSSRLGMRPMFSCNK